MAMDSSPENAYDTHVYVPEEWEEAADTIAYDSITSPPPICVVCGPPNSGKTTFSRHLLNVLVHRYSRVAYLDTDVGQAEFTPPGCLSLTVVDKVTPGLAIPCVRTPERCFFFGDVTSGRGPKMYLAYICALYDYYKENYQRTVKNIGVPLVVNTPGWIEGTGFKILLHMLKYIAPSQVVKVHTSAENKNLPAGPFWLEEGGAQEVTLLEIKSHRHDSSKKLVHAQKDARLLRDIRLLAYFRLSFPVNTSLTTIQELDHGLASLPPYEVLISTITIKHLHCQVPCSETIYNSNSMIVGLAVSSPGSEHLPFCVGLGIVRGVDTFRKILYLITPVPKSILKNVDLLLHGTIKIPDYLLQVHGHLTDQIRNPQTKRQ